MFPRRYFAARMFAPRYFSQTAGAPIVVDDRDVMAFVLPIRRSLTVRLKR